LATDLRPSSFTVLEGQSCSEQSLLNRGCELQSVECSAPCGLADALCSSKNCFACESKFASVSKHCPDLSWSSRQCPKCGSEGSRCAEEVNFLVKLHLVVAEMKTG